MANVVGKNEKKKWPEKKGLSQQFFIWFAYNEMEFDFNEWHMFF